MLTRPQYRQAPSPAPSVRSRRGWRPQLPLARPRGLPPQTHGHPGAGDRGPLREARKKVLRSPVRPEQPGLGVSDWISSVESLLGWWVGGWVEFLQVCSPWSRSLAISGAEATWPQSHSTQSAAYFNEEKTAPEKNCPPVRDVREMDLRDEGVGSRRGCQMTARRWANAGATSKTWARHSPSAGPLIRTQSARPVGRPWPHKQTPYNCLIPREGSRRAAHSSRLSPPLSPPPPPVVVFHLNAPVPALSKPPPERIHGESVWIVRFGGCGLVLAFPFNALAVSAAGETGRPARGI